MIIDEINRANLPKVLGELLFLFEYRDEQVRTLYRPDDAFELPKDLWFIGTMNTADRSIALVDAALRRRFHFVPVLPQPGPMAGPARSLARQHGEPAWVGELVAMVNDELAEALGGPHLQLGPSHFMKHGLDEAALRRIWEYNIEPFIEDQFFGDPAQIDHFRFDAVLQRYREQSGVDELDRARRASSRERPSARRRPSPTPSADDAASRRDRRAADARRVRDRPAHARPTRQARRLAATGVVTVAPAPEPGWWLVTAQELRRLARRRRRSAADPARRSSPRTSSCCSRSVCPQSAWRREAFDYATDADLLPSVIAFFARTVETTLARGVLRSYREHARAPRRAARAPRPRRRSSPAPASPCRSPAGSTTTRPTSPRTATSRPPCAERCGCRRCRPRTGGGCMQQLVALEDVADVAVARRRPRPHRDHPAERPLRAGAAAGPAAAREPHARRPARCDRPRRRSWST